MHNDLINARRLRLPLTVLLLASAAVQAQQINVTAANASNDAIYSVAFSGSSGSISILNTDGGSLHNLTSLVFYPNAITFQLDLLAADNGGKIVRYPGDFQGGSPTTGTVLFAAGGPPGPQNPDGLSTDSAGNLFVVNAKNGGSSNPQLWVMTPDGLGGFNNPASIDSSYGSSEVLDDTLVVGTTIVPPGAAVVTGSVTTGVLTVTAVTGTVVVGALIAGTGVPANTVVSSQLTGPTGGIGTYQLSNSFTVVSETLTQPVLEPGDLLVLTTNPSQVLRYANVNGHGPTGAATPTVLLTLPAGALPGGLAFWPPDNSLLITTSRGTIYQYHFASGDPATFASGLGNGQFKVKTGIQFGVPYAYVANNNGGDILQFTGPNQLQATITSGVQHPQGLATTNIAYAPVSACQQPNGCSLLGGGSLPGGSVITHNIPSKLNVSGNVVENVCLVPVDPRLVPPSSSCTTDLPVSEVCAGFSDTVVIPASLCGSSGSTGKGFALIKTLTQAYGGAAGFPFNGSLVSDDSNLPNVLPASSGNPVCNPSKKGVGPSPLGTLAWAPLPGEGIVVEGNYLLETTNGCDGSTNRQSGLSLAAVGLAVNASSPADLVNFTSAKYTTVLGEESSEVSNLALVAPIPPSQQPPAGNFTYQLQQCIATSQGAFAAGSNFYSGAAAEVLTAEGNIALALATPPNPPPFAANATYPNPSGSLRWRLENIYYTINTRLQLNLAGSAPPSPPPPPPPSITGTPPKASAGVFYTFTPTAHDFAHQTATSNLSFSIAGQPSWVTNFDTTKGTLSGTPPKGGSASGIVITVYDGCASAALSISIKVTG